MTARIVLSFAKVALLPKFAREWLRRRDCCYTPLTKAALQGDLETVADLLDKGADVNSSTSAGRTPLSIAIQEGNILLFGELLRRSADPLADRYGALLSCLGTGRLDMFHLLIDVHLDQHAPAPLPGCLLSQAVMANSPEAVERFLGLELHDRPSSCREALDRAVSFGRLEVVRVLLDGGADMDGLSDGWSPLGRAAANGSEEVASELLSRGAAPDLLFGNQSTALLVAAARGHAGVVRRLLAFGANPAHRNLKGLDARSVASRHRHPAIVEMLEAAKESRLEGCGSRPPWA